MTVKEIIEAVRYCYDEQAFDGADFNNASANDNIYMDNIIKAKIGDAVRWICLYAPVELLGDSDTEDNPTGILVDKEGVPTDIDGTDGGFITMPEDFIKLARVRVKGWHRAVKTPLEEDSDEYLQLYDDNGAKATADRPQAALIEKSQRVIEVWPTGEKVEYTYVAETKVDVSQSATEDTKVPLPPRVKTAFIYYLSFLTLSAYEDSRAVRMLEIAKMNIGKNGQE